MVLSAVFCDSVMLGSSSDCEDCVDLRVALDMLFDLYDAPDDFEYHFKAGAAPLRFFLAYAASQKAFHGIINCDAHLKTRPLQPLIEALRKAGARIECLEREGFPPLKVKGSDIEGLDGSFGIEQSSQFTSALMMASLIWDKEYLPPKGASIVSGPYVEMTRKMIAQFKKIDDEAEAKGYPIIYNVEKDWSAASYFYELILADPSKKITFDSLVAPAESLQGDSRCAEIFARAGVRTIYKEDGRVEISADEEKIKSLAEADDLLSFDLCDTPDLVPALAVGLCLAGIRFTISGIGHLKFKESDRLSVLSKEMARAGYLLRVDESSLSWEGKRVDPDPSRRFDSHDDHRIAMALSILTVRLGKIRISKSNCVAKSFPRFFEELEKTGIEMPILG